MVQDNFTHMPGALVELAARLGLAGHAHSLVCFKWPLQKWLWQSYTVVQGSEPNVPGNKWKLPISLCQGLETDI